MKPVWCGQKEISGCIGFRNRTFSQEIWVNPNAFEKLIRRKQVRAFEKETGLRRRRPPIKSWPRLIKNIYHHSPFSYEITPLPASIS